MNQESQRRYNTMTARAPHVSTSRLHSLGLLPLLLLGCLAVAPAQDVAEREIEMTPEAEAAAAHGLEYIANQMTPEGTWPGGFGRNTAVCSFAGLAFMACGHVPGRGEYGRHIERIVEYVASQASPSGLIVAENDSSGKVMYEHAIATVFLAEVYGMSPTPGLRDRLERAVDLISTTQNREGGWRYGARPHDADLSVTVMVLMGLRAANEVGVRVPRQVIDNAVRYVRACIVPTGGFAYQPGRAARYGTTAAGVFSMQMSGEYTAPEVVMGLRYLQDNNPRVGEHYFYGVYYAAMSMYQAEEETLWQEWYPSMRAELLESQAGDGHWNCEAGPVYGTAMGVLTLAVPYRYLPIYQR